MTTDNEAVIDERFGRIERRMLAKPIGRLDAALEPGERLEQVTSAMVDGVGVMLAVTDRRVLALGKHLHTAIALETVAQVSSVTTGPSTATVAITGPGASIEAKMPRKHAERIAAQVRAVPAR